MTAIAIEIATGTVDNIVTHGCHLFDLGGFSKGVTGTVKGGLIQSGVSQFRTNQSVSRTFNWLDGVTE